MSGMKEAAAIGIIGGADGPTAIFITGGFPRLLLAAAVAVVGIAVLLIWRQYKKE